MRNHLFTSESVSAGHPDKVADQISDAILDEFLRQDPNSKVACETFCTTGLVMVAGEVKSNAYVDIVRLKSELTATDYQVIKSYEYALTEQPLPYDLSNLHSERQQLRERIRKLKQIILNPSNSNR